MKKITSIVFATLLLIGGVSFVPSRSAYAQTVDAGQIIELLIAIGVIPPEKLPAINSILESIRNKNALPVTSDSATISAPSAESVAQKTERVNKVTQVNNFSTNSDSTQLIVSGTNFDVNATTSVTISGPNITGEYVLKILSISSDSIQAELPDNLTPGDLYSGKVYQNGIKLVALTSSFLQR